MHSIFRRALLAAAILLPALAATRPAGAEPVVTHPPHNPRGAVVLSLDAPADITSAFLVHAGDDPAYASPAFNDSAWQPLSTARPLASLGIAQRDFVWYRLHLRIPPHSRSLALLLLGFNGSQQIFVNGVLTGPNRDFSGGGAATPNFDSTASLPDALTQSGELVIAIRAYIHNSRHSLAGQPGFSSSSLLLLGNSSVLDNRLALDSFYEYASNVVDTSFTAVVLVITIALWIALRKEREYLYLAVYLACTIYGEVLAIVQSRYDLRLGRAAIVAYTLVNILSLLAALEFARIVLRLPRRRWITAYESVMAVLLLISGVVNLLTFNSGAPPLPVLWAMLALYALAAGSLGVGLPIYALYLWRRTRNFDALLLSLPILARGLFLYLYLGYDVYSVFRYNAVHTLPNPPFGPFGVSWLEVCDFVFLLALLLFLILRTVRLARARAALAQEIAAAQSVQQLLLARAAHPTPGFLVETVYHPASEVGGDFFLILPSTHFNPLGAPSQAQPAVGSQDLLIVVGDVSGKGLGAAMRVAMILGVLARETSRNPAEVLANLNAALFAQASGPTQLGFTTAACLYLSATGEFRLANAGHIPPYLAGQDASQEFPAPPSLPLGLAAQAAYETVSGRLAPGQRLIFLSDGIPEARDHHGTLLGFDRLPALTLLPAPEIAATAQRFGQEDDITVLTVALA